MLVAAEDVNHCSRRRRFLLLDHNLRFVVLQFLFAGQFLPDPGIVQVGITTNVRSAAAARPRQARADHRIQHLRCHGSDRVGGGRILWVAQRQADLALILGELQLLCFRGRDYQGCRGRLGRRLGVGRRGSRVESPNPAWGY